VGKASTIYLFIIKSFTEYNKAKAKSKNQTISCQVIYNAAKFITR